MAKKSRQSQDPVQIRLGKNFDKDLTYQIKKGTVAEAFVSLLGHLGNIFRSTEDIGRFFKTMTFISYIMFEKVIDAVSVEDLDKILSEFRSLVDESGYHLNRFLREKLEETEEFLAIEKEHRKHMRQVTRRSRHMVRPTVPKKTRRSDRAPERQPATMADQLKGLIKDGALQVDVIASDVSDNGYDDIEISGMGFVVSSRGKVFHRVGSPEAKKVKRGRRFDTADEAIEAGFKPSKRLLREVTARAAA